MGMRVLKTTRDEEKKVRGFISYDMNSPTTSKKILTANEDTFATDEI